MSSDPVSDFLAREQNAMADLNLIGNDEFVQDPQIRSDLENGFLAGEYHSTGDSTDFSLTNGDMNPMQNSYTGADINRSAVSTPMEVEPEKIRKWREEQQKKIEQKDEAEEKRKEELRSQATKELQEWHTERKKRIEERKNLNREREIKHLDENESSVVDNKSTWGRISKMVESAGAKSTRSGSTKDLGRMKSLIQKRCDERNVDA